MSEAGSPTPLLDEENEASWALLHDQIELADGFWLAFLFSLGLIAPRVLADRTEVMLRGMNRGFRRWRPARPESMREVLIEVVAAAREGTTDCLWIETLTERLDETAPESAWEEARSEFLMRANEQREVFAKRHRGPLVLVLPPGAKVTAQERAPDLWAYREFVAELTVKLPTDLWKMKLESALPMPPGAIALSAEEERIVRKAEEGLARATRFAEALSFARLALDSLQRAGRWDELRRMLIRALSLPRTPVDPDALLANALRLLATIESYQGDAVGALERVKAALAYADALSVERRIDMHITASNLCMELRDSRAAHEYSTAGLVIARQLASQRSDAKTLFDLLLLSLLAHANQPDELDETSTEFSYEDVLRLGATVLQAPGSTKKMRAMIARVYEAISTEYDSIGRPDDSERVRAEIAALLAGKPTPNAKT